MTTKSSPLSFILWHWPAEGVSAGDYYRALSRFHTALKDEPPDGFLESGVVRFDALPWIAAPGPIYQDWYVITDFTAMGILNDGAVDGSRKSPHDEVAGMAADGVGGLYAVEAGQPSALSGGLFHWLRKPEDRNTPEYLRSLKDIALAAGGTLWRRQMNLGVAPEYCLRAERRIDAAGVEQVMSGMDVWPA